MSEHTPGPWKVETVRTSSGICHTIGPFPFHGKKAHACIYADYPSVGPEERALEANARLIAAAPELLAALKAYLVAKPQCECSDHSGCPMASARVLARAAIAKAEGAA